MIGDAREDIGEPCLGIDAIHLCGGDQAVHHRGSLAAAIGTREEKVRPGVHGFGDPMAGLIIVTTDKKLLQDNPKTASEKILPNYFGG